MTEHDIPRVILVGRFCIWARSLKDCQGIPYVTPEIRTWIEAALEQIREDAEAAIKRRKTARKAGRLGGRPRTDNPAPSTIRARRSRAKKKKKAKKAKEQ